MEKLISVSIIISLIQACTFNKPADEKATNTTTTISDSAIEIQVQSEPDTLKGSLKARATGKIGDANLTINYHSPAVRGRIIWGGLVANDKVWVTGAHMATHIEFDKDIAVGNSKVPSGKYALFTIPGSEEWMIIINKNWQQHLADDYDSKDDVIRLKVKPETTESNQERLRYVIDSVSNTEGEVVIYWEKLSIHIPFTVSE